MHLLTHSLAWSLTHSRSHLSASSYMQLPSTLTHIHTHTSTHSHLLFSDVDGLVGDDPGDRLVAGGHGRGSLVGHVVGRAGEEVVHAQVSHAVPVTCTGGGGALVHLNEEFGF